MMVGKAYFNFKSNFSLNNCNSVGIVFICHNIFSLFRFIHIKVAQKCAVLFCEGLFQLFPAALISSGVAVQY
jgi:hypothetical protein